MKYDNLWTSYPRVPLTDLLSFIVDNRGKTVPTSDSGIALIATNCVTNNTLYPVFEKIRYLSEDTYKNWFRAHPEPGDILFVNKGTPGRVCMVPSPVNFCIAQDMIALRADSKKLYNRFLFAVLRSKEIQTQIYNTNVGDTIPHFKKQFLNQILVPLPDMKIQKFIGDTYFKFSEKIELNNKINANLQQQAQALFKSWFIDFEPWGGVMPEDWRELTLDEICKKITDGSHFSPQDSPISDIPMCSVKDMDEFGFDFSRCKHISKEDFCKLKSSDCVPEVDDILVAKDGSYLKHIFMCNEYRDMAILSSIAIFRPDTSIITPSFLLTLLKSDNILRTVRDNFVSGSALPRIVLKDFKKLKLTVPPLDIQRKLSSVLDESYKLIFLNCKENRRLAELRDTLLPKLMSGELDVSDMELSEVSDA